MQIFIKFTDRKIFTLDIEPSITIKTLKKEISIKSETKFDEHMRLIYAGKDLQNEKTTMDYNIQKESTLFPQPCRQIGG